MKSTMRSLTQIFCLICMFGRLAAQQQWTEDRSLAWSNQPKTFTTSSGRAYQEWSFKGAGSNRNFGHLPMWSERFLLPQNGTFNVRLIPVQVNRINLRKEDITQQSPETDFIVQTEIEQERDKYYGRVLVLPIRQAGAGFERLEKFTLQMQFVPTAATNPGTAATSRGGNTYQSVLRDGQLYKFGVTKTGIYKLDYNYLKNELKVQNLDNLDPRTIRIYGNGPQSLPQTTGTARPDDLIENAIKVVGENDGKFDGNDYILIFAEGGITYTHEPNSSSTQLTGDLNIYSKENVYFLKVGAGNGLRIPEASAANQNGVAVSEFDDIQRLEEDKVNLLDFYSLAQGSGQRWYGDYFKESRSRTYTDKFKFAGAVTGTQGRFRARFAGRCATVSTVRLTVGDAVVSRTIGSVVTSENEATYALDVDISGTFMVNSEQPNVVLDYLQSASVSEGWLDFIELQVRRKLAYTSGALIFRDLASVNRPVTEFNLLGASAPGLQVWDITDPLLPREQKLNITGDIARFGVNTAQKLRTFVSFTLADAQKPQIAIGSVGNQNIHGIEKAELAIVYHKNFKEQAERLAEHRRTYSKLETVTVDIDQLYNEFSSGKKDPSAIRDFARVLLDRDTRFKYLLLFGDGSFDPRGISDAPQGDFIPAFETPTSLEPIYSYPADDYFGLLSDNEGAALRGSLDIAVGRLPVATKEDATAVVDKIIAYDKDPITLGDWHNRTLFFADDEDGNVHLDQAEDLEAMTKSRMPIFNSDKIYLDAYRQVATSGGQFYPEAKKAFNASFFKGNLLLTYIGHGGPRGWTQERTVDNNDIALWGNENRCPLIISATCSFGGYDNPRFLCGGEQSILKAKSGAIALFTTVRSVYISGNNQLTDAVESVMFTKENGRFRSMGDVLSTAKNILGINEENARRFTLLGDPAQILALPEYVVATTSINGKPYNPAQPDTISALDRVTLTGEVRDTLGNLLSGFNGRVFVTVFDKPQTLRTLGQDNGSYPVNFEVQRSIIFRGAATVRGGKFDVQFTTPKDINYAPGKGKISYYAENGTHLDAAGSDEGFVVAGINNTIKDDQPPVVQVFMNDDKFVTGGVTDSNPRIYAKISDDFGINISGTAIGHDLTAVLDANVQETVVLNDFYQSNLDDSKSGTVTYPLNQLKPGLHKVEVEAWDIANNRGVGYTEFFVTNSANAALEHVLNYPNPFTTSTSFQFEHNLVGQVLDIQVRIFSVSGKLVKTIQHQTTAQGYRVTDIMWDGKDDFGDPIGKGVYVYKVAVRGTDLAGRNTRVESNFEKLVILR